jgi:hypothetical protein
MTTRILLVLLLATPAFADVPLEAIDRPVVLATGEAGFATNVDVQRPSVGMPDVTTMSIGGGFGLGDRLELGANYRFAFDAFQLRGPLTMYGAALLAHSPRWSVAAGADLAVDWANPVTMSTQTTETLHMGIGVRGDLSRNVAIYSGNIIAPNPAGQQLAIGLQHGAATTFDVPLGIAIQASRRVLFRIETTMARFAIAHARDSFVVADQTPLTFNVLLAATRGLDVAAFYSDSDIAVAGDRYTLGVVARWYSF